MTNLILKTRSAKTIERRPAKRKTKDEKVLLFFSCLKHWKHFIRDVGLAANFGFFHVVITESSESSDGNEYPLDVWLVLSSYIRPEDVCRFALICRSAWIATCTAAFWTRLYRRWSAVAVINYSLFRLGPYNHTICLKWKGNKHTGPDLQQWPWLRCDESCTQVEVIVQSKGQRDCIMKKIQCYQVSFS